ncbi:hypothetical protein ACIQWB_14005 [Streptomyces olivaceus]|uniref:hypothetical protein n=1 Tax=Streptomyces olivaceus TaxID=47716 RepID=UPI0038287A2F
MATLSTEQVTTHTLKLTHAELQALRQAAAIAVKSDPEHADAERWRGFVKLGQPATRENRAAAHGAGITPTL